MQTLGRIADGAREAQFGDIVGKDAVDVIQFSASH